MLSFHLSALGQGALERSAPPERFELKNVFLLPKMANSQAKTPKVQRTRCFSSHALKIGLILTARAQLSFCINVSRTSGQRVSRYCNVQFWGWKKVLESRHFPTRKSTFCPGCLHCRRRGVWTQELHKTQSSNSSWHVRAGVSGRDSNFVRLKKLNEESALGFDLRPVSKRVDGFFALGQFGGHFLHATFWAWQLWNHAPRSYLERVERNSTFVVLFFFDIILKTRASRAFSWALQYFSN